MLRITRRAFPKYVAVVGSGPSSLYSAKYVLRDSDAKVHVYERLPVPFGLIRYGVAPDHPEVKYLATEFEEVFEKHRNRLKFFGNVEIGKDIPLSQLICDYSAVILGTGAQEVCSSNLKNHKLPGIFPARDFVMWYNRHPDFQDLDFSKFLKNKTSRIVILGHGNVALDCARVLMLSQTSSKLDESDISETSLEQLREANISSIVILGRRGFVQATFTNKELRELLRLPGGSLTYVDPEDISLSLNENSVIELNNSRPKKRTKQILDKMAENFSKPRKRGIQIRFLVQPQKYLGENRVTHVEVRKTHLRGNVNQQEAEAEGEVELLKADLVLESVGFRTQPFPEVSSKHLLGHVRDNVFVTGWLKRGPRGVIAENIPCAEETARSVTEFLTSEKEIEEPKYVLQKRVTSFDDWMKIKKKEAEIGKERGKRAVKLWRTEDFLRCL